MEPGKVASDLITLPMLFAGVPEKADLPAIEDQRRKGGKVIYFVTPDEQTRINLRENEAGVVWSTDTFVKQFLFDHIHGWVGGKLGTFDGQVGAKEGDENRAQRLASMMQDVLQLWSFDTTSAKHLFAGQVPYKNQFRNHRWIEDGAPFQAFKGRGKGVTTILVAAGPSLDSQWEHLKRIRDHRKDVGFIVCGRSYKAAMKAGINPEFIQEVEQFEWDDRLFLFAPEPPENSYLVGPLSACPNLFHAWPNRGKVCITWDHNYAQMMGDSAEQIANHEHSMDGGNSIIHHMFNFAVWLGSETICLAGVDFAYPPGHQATHALGTFHHWNYDVLKTEHNYQVPMDVPSTAGGMVQSSQPYRNFCTFMEISIQKSKKFVPNLKVVNFSPKGQKIEGTVYEDVSTWALPSPLPSSAPLSSPLQSGQVPFCASLESASTDTSTASSAPSLPVEELTPTKTDTTEASKTASA